MWALKSNTKNATVDRAKWENVSKQYSVVVLVIIVVTEVHTRKRNIPTAVAVVHSCSGSSNCSSNADCKVFLIVKPYVLEIY